MALAVVHDLREARAPAGPDELAAFETDTLAGLVLARAAAGLADSTIAGEVIHLEQVRTWLGRPLWTMQPADADAYFGQVLRGAARGTRLARAQALKTYFLFLELRHKVEIHQMTGQVVACPADEVNRPRGSQDAALRIPPSQAQAAMLIAGWRGELAQCRKALPALLDWSARYHHLREVTRDDIQDHVRPLRGSQRHNTLVALRSLFKFCLSAGVIFRNPAQGIKVGRRLSSTVLQPLGQDDIDNAVAAAATPAARLIVALAAVHAARSSTICALLLRDADPGSGRLLLNGRPRPLDDLTARLLRTWLEVRRARWPVTANPHLLINAQTALGTGPASRTWVNSALRGHAATIEALRADRQLEEALATGADPLHLAATFGLDPGTAVRYASSARQLLQTPAEQPNPAGIPPNPRPGSAHED